MIFSVLYLWLVTSVCRGAHPRHHHHSPRVHFIPGSHAVDLRHYPTLLDVIHHEGAKTFLKLLKETELYEGLAKDDKYTVFLPSEHAFSKLSPSYLKALKKDDDMLQSFVYYHVIPEKLTSYDIKDGMIVPTLSGANLTFHLGHKSVGVGNTYLTVGNIQASNGVVHILDDVLRPPVASTIMKALGSCGSYKTLVELIEQSGLDKSLGDPEKRYTLFAPREEAFKSVNDEFLETLKGNDTLLKEFLESHALKGVYYSHDFPNGYVEAYHDNALLTEVHNGRLREVNEARVIKADISTGNGVIHSIDRLLGDDC